MYHVLLSVKQQEAKHLLVNQLCNVSTLIIDRQIHTAYTLYCIN